MPIPHRLKVQSSERWGRFQGLHLTTAVVACGLSGTAFADRLGDFQLSNGDVAVLAALLSLPGALVCGLLEWVGGKRRFPLWLGAIAMLALIYSESVGLGHPGYSSGLREPLVGVGAWMHTHTLFNIYWYAIIEAVFSWCTAPVYGTIAMVGLVPDPRWRRVAVWGVSLLSVGLFCLMFPSRQAAINVPSVQEEIPIFVGAAMSLCMWTAFHVWRQASLARARKKGMG